MIALITSCINPSNLEDGAIRSFINEEQRLQQTITTINKLQDYPLHELYLLDNSHSLDFEQVKSKTSANLNIHHFRQYQFINKGINELLMLLAIVDELPDNESIFKISGRYAPNEHFECKIDEGFDFKVLPYNFYSKTGTISTRAYFVANKAVYKQFLLKTLNELFVYPTRIVGLRSALNAIQQFLNPSTSNPINASIEFAAARVLKMEKYKVRFAEPMGIEGTVAGSDQLDFISE